MSEEVKEYDFTRAEIGKSSSSLTDASTLITCCPVTGNVSKKCVLK